MIKHKISVWHIIVNSYSSRIWDGKTKINRTENKSCLLDIQTVLYKNKTRVTNITSEEGTSDLWGGNLNVTCT